MNTKTPSFRARRTLRRAEKTARAAGIPIPEGKAKLEEIDLEIAPNDPVIAFFHQAAGPVEIEKVEIDSPGAQALRDAGVKLVVPLLSQGELIGLLNLGPRLSEQEYSGEDRKLLDNLAGQVAPAIRNAQLVLQQKVEVAARERIQQDIETGRIVQQNFLPKELPSHPGWDVAVHYRAARTVGGDFYDFIELPDNRIAVLSADVTDKGVPAAMVMVAARALLQAYAQELIWPSAVLQRVNELMCDQVPPKMFITCLYGVLDLNNGTFRYANAGHNLPYVAADNGVLELRARGMPLGLLHGMTYEEKEATIEPGQTMLLHSDGIAESHDPAGEMFGFPRLMGLLTTGKHGEDLIDLVLTEHSKFVGPDWEQEDDITLVTIGRHAGAGYEPAEKEVEREVSANGTRVLAEFTIPSKEGNERIVMKKVEEAVRTLNFEKSRLEKLKTAVGEATMNAIEHGNKNNPELNVEVTVAHEGDSLIVRIKDHGGGVEIEDRPTPNLEAKLAGEQTPRGWGLFLIKNMVDDMKVSSDADHHIVELTMHLKGA